MPVVQGVSLPDLSRGVGHYPKTAVPGEIGNFAVAGHRATNGEPFAHLDAVQVGDSLVVETRSEWLTYVVDKVRIVAPSAVWVLDPVPGKPDRATDPPADHLDNLQPAVGLDAAADRVRPPRADAADASEGPDRARSRRELDVRLDLAPPARALARAADESR